MRHELRLFPPADGLAVFGLRGAGAAGGRLCRRRVRAAGADRGGRGRDGVGAPRRPRQGRRGDRHAGERATRRSRWRRPKPRSHRPRRCSPISRSADARKKSPCWRRRSIPAQAQKEEAERVLTRLADLLKRGHLDTGRLRPGPDRARRRDRDGRTGRGQSRRRQAAGARRRRSRRRKTRSSRRRRSSRQAQVAAVQAHDLGALRPAASTTSSAIPATSPGRRRRCSRCCRTAR